VLAALQATLEVGDGTLFRAGSALSGGVAWRGETCGALIGALMAIGAVAGRARLEDVGQLQRIKAPAAEMYVRFGQQVGHTLCAEIHRLKFGRAYRLYDPAELKAFHAAGGHGPTGCPQVCGAAARAAAEIILELRES
jgi:C_GCAxxG_C_C family probable redox protein